MSPHKAAKTLQAHTFLLKRSLFITLPIYYHRSELKRARMVLHSFACKGYWNLLSDFIVVVVVVRRCVCGIRTEIRSKYGIPGYFFASFLKPYLKWVKDREVNLVKLKQTRKVNFLFLYVNEICSTSDPVIWRYWLFLIFSLNLSHILLLMFAISIFISMMSTEWTDLDTFVLFLN